MAQFYAKLIKKAPQSHYLTNFLVHIERKKEKKKKAAFELENICNVSYSFYRSQELET